MRGAIPFKARLSSAGTKDADHDALKYLWKVTAQNGGVTKTFTEANPTMTFDKPGVYKATLTVTDAKGGNSSRSLQIMAGNEEPVLTFETNNSNQTFFFPNQPFEYEVKVSDKEDGSLANGKIKPEAVAVNIDYLPEGYDLVTIAQGHRSADAAAGVVKGLSLIESSDCKACHSIEKKSIGPAYKQVALKYKDDAGATKRLAKKVISGGSGVWGEVAMSAHPQFSQADATEMVKFVLSLTQEKKAVNTLPVKGSYPITIPAGEKGDGRFIVRAAYKDKGNNGIPAITAEKTMLLRSAKIQAGKADKTDNVMKYGTIIIATVTNSSIGFHNLDLTSISQVAFTANAPKAQLNAAGGVIEVHLDAPTGKLIGQTSLISPSTGGSLTNMPPPVVAKLSGVTGIHDVYFVFKNDQAPAGQSLMVLIDAEFQTAKSATSKAVGTSDATPQKSLSAKELETYAGKYKMTGLPFEYIEVTPKDGKLHMNAGGNEGELSPSQETDVFAGGNGTQLKFNRNTDQKVTTLTLKAQGMSFEGTKE